MKTIAPTSALPSLNLADWRATRDSLHDYALIMGTIRGWLTPPEPHWTHVSLSVVSDGLTTTPMPIAADHAEIRLNLCTNRLEFVHLQGTATSLPLSGQSQQTIAEWLVNQLQPLHAPLATQKLPAWKKTPYILDPVASTHFGTVLTAVATLFEETRLQIPGRTSPLQLWPHHFDLAFLWFSGRKIPGKDPADLDNSDEQINIGFVTGDESIPDAYFYATAYPEPANLAQKSWPAPSRWYETGWHGVVASYSDFLKQTDPAAGLAGWLSHVHAEFRTAITAK